MVSAKHVCRLRLGLFLALVTASFASFSASLTTYRIYLDDTNRSESFIVFSSSNIAEQCSLDFKYFNFDENANMTLHRGEEPPANAAEDWVRYSPRNFVLEENRPQTIRFSMRRKPNAEAKEYRSYISVSCDPVQSDAESNKAADVPNDRPSVQVKPKLVQNVPLIIRTGPLDAKASFQDVVLVNNIVKGKITRSGNRSIYGDISIINKKTNEQIAFTKSISVYPETTSYNFELSFPSDKAVSADDLLVRFTEDEHYGGSLIFEQGVK